MAKKKAEDAGTDDLPGRLREAADRLEGQPQAQAALGGGRLLRRILDLLLAEITGQGQQQTDAQQAK